MEQKSIQIFPNKKFGNKIVSNITNYIEILLLSIITKNFNFGILKFANFHTYEGSEQPLVFIQLLFIFLLTIVVFNWN